LEIKMLATLQVVRGQDGQIRQINKIMTAQANIAIAAVSVGALLGGGYAIFTIRSMWDLDHVFIGVVLLVPGIMLLATALRRASQKAASTISLADKWGVSLPAYPELGVVPWSAISGFRVVPAGYFTALGDQALILDLNEPERFARKLRAGNALAPGRFRAPPFALVEGSRSVDVASLKVAMDELRSQGLSE